MRTQSCIVCFEIIPSDAACKQLQCRHATCDECLRMHIRSRLESGDASTVVCPHPRCRMPFSLTAVRNLFGTNATEPDKLGMLKAHKFVDMHKESTWCPNQACAKVVLLIDRTQQGLVQCSCGTKFCFFCKELGGHDPLNCKQWKSWHDYLKLFERDSATASEKWIAENSRECRCGANIQKNGGCNHMICSVCGHNFCYVCGQDWKDHQRQPGGFDHFTCRMPQESPGIHAHSVMSTSWFPSRPPQGDESRRGWMANVRDGSKEKRILSLFRYISSTFEFESQFVTIAEHGVHVSSKARKTLQQCYALMYFLSSKFRKHRLAIYVGDLETAVSALEAVLGLNIIDAELNKDSIRLNEFSDTSQNTFQCFDFYGLLPHLVAASEIIQSADRLSMAVELQTARVLYASRTAAQQEDAQWPGGGLASIASGVGDLLGAVQAEGNRCLIM